VTFAREQIAQSHQPPRATATISASGPGSKGMLQAGSPPDRSIRAHRRQRQPDQPEQFFTALSHRVLNEMARALRRAGRRRRCGLPFRMASRRWSSRCGTRSWRGGAQSSCAADSSGLRGCVGPFTAPPQCSRRACAGDVLIPASRIEMTTTSPLAPRVQARRLGASGCRAGSRAPTHCHAGRCRTSLPGPERNWV
jgi:hypothetical protein